MSATQTVKLQAKTPFSLAIFDVLWGFIAFAVVIVVSFFYQDMRPFLLATCLAFFGAGFYRAGVQSIGTPSSAPWKRLLQATLFVALGGILPAVIMNKLGIALTGSSFFLSLLLASLVNAVLGILFRSLISRARMKYALVFGCLWALSILAIVYKAIPDWMDSRAYVAVDRDTTPFRIQTLTGKSLASGDWKGRVVVLSFWATWCSPCHAELPEIQALQNKYRGNPNVLIFALDSATGGDTSAIAQAYLDAKKLTLTGTIDSADSGDTAGDSWGPAARSLGIKGIPALYILDRSGRLRAIHLGYDSSEHLTKTLTWQIDQLL
jgi:thiol-disulfide isomerase/thioredoxin